MSNITHKEVLPEKFLKSVLRKALRASNTLSLVWFTLWRKKEGFRQSSGTVPRLRRWTEGWEGRATAQFVTCYTRCQSQ